MYDVAVVGAGLIGSACAKYLSAKGLRVALLGRSEAQGALGACYDEGRIYRIADPDKVWADLADLSIKEYEAIKDEAGESFYQENGFLAIGDPALEYIRQVEETMAQFGTEGKDYFVYSGKEALEEHFPFLRLPFDEHSWKGIWQPKKAGHLSPRALAKIQAVLAKRNGTDVISRNLEQAEPQDDHWILHLEGSQQVEAQKVVLAAGWMTKWLVPDKSLDITTQMSQAVLFEVTPEAATSLASMPVLILRGPKDPEEFWYILPPIKYPDGRWYLKMGYDGNMLNQRLESKEEALNWMKAKQARPELVSVAQQMAARYFPGQRRPYIDYLDKGVAVASGGNGWAAKSSDHIGWLASEMLSNSSEWATDPVSKALFPKELFRASFKASERSRL
ncbi:unnamed protein product [Durusdinium trenchii]|uniref:FAD dependent oxidoreductase domain-containing protein n=1 Tax=Durusdinium trenchii TaxID=1381693 RepID=A0ABP0S9C2_9DINO